jgi:hypothetical protein
MMCCAAPKHGTVEMQCRPEDGLAGENRPALVRLKVMYEDKSPLPGVSITVSQFGMPTAAIQTTTDDDGNAGISLPAGRWSIKMEFPDLFALRKELTVQDGEYCFLSASMVAETHWVPDVVDWTPMIDRESTSMSYRIPEYFFEHLP